jgi:hypothetical protein
VNTKHVFAPIAFGDDNEVEVDESITLKRGK